MWPMWSAMQSSMMSPMVSSTMVSTIGASAFCAMVLCAALGLTSNAGIDSSAVFSVLVLMLVGLYIGLEYASRKRREAEVLELCQKYDVHPQNGFLPETCPQRLSEPYFQPWETLAANLPRLNRTKQLRKSVIEMKVLDAGRLRSKEDVRRAYVILSLIGQSYVHGEDAIFEDEGKRESSNCTTPTEHKAETELPAKHEVKLRSSSKHNDHLDYLSKPSPLRVPRPLSVPWTIVARRLGMPPILTHTAADHWNWRRQTTHHKRNSLSLDTSSKYLSLSDLRLITTVTGNLAEEYFHLMVTCMGFRLGPLLTRCIQLHTSIQNDKAKDVISLLIDLDKALLDCTSIFKQGCRLIPPKFFFHTHRPFLRGFKTERYSGVIMEGVPTLPPSTSTTASSPHLKLRTMPHTQQTSNQALLEFKGGSAAQHAFIQLLDVLLGIKHNQEVRSFQLEMREYMPPPHRKLLTDMELTFDNGNLLKAYISRKKENEPSLSVAYKRAVHRLQKFRNFHKGVAFKYISDGTQGTGSTPFKTFLEKAIIATSVED